MVGITGGTCAGKTTLIRSIQSGKQLAQTAFVSQQDYFIANAERHPIKQDDWENPGYLLFDALVADLRTLRQSPHQLVIAEGYLLLYTAELRALFDLTIYIDLPIEDTVRRRLERTGDKPWDDAEYIKDKLPELHRLYVLPQRSAAQHIFDGRQEPGELVSQTLTMIGEVVPSAVL